MSESRRKMTKEEYDKWEEEFFNIMDGLEEQGYDPEKAEFLAGLVMSKELSLSEKIQMEKEYDNANNSSGQISPQQNKLKKIANRDAGVDTKFISQVTQGRGERANE